MEVGLFWWWSLDDVHLWRSLTHSFVSNSSGDDFIPIDKASWWCVIIFYSDLHSFVANGPCYYCIDLWLILGVSLMKLLWKFFFFFFKENFMKILDVGTWYELICQKGKIYRYLWDVFLMLWTILGWGVTVAIIALWLRYLFQVSS